MSSLNRDERDACWTAGREKWMYAVAEIFTNTLQCYIFMTADSKEVFSQAASYLPNYQPA